MATESNIFNFKFSSESLEQVDSAFVQGHFNVENDIRTALKAASEGDFARATIKLSQIIPTLERVGNQQNHIALLDDAKALKALQNNFSLQEKVINYFDNEDAEDLNNYIAVQLERLDFSLANATTAEKASFSPAQKQLAEIQSNIQASLQAFQIYAEVDQDPAVMALRKSDAVSYQKQYHERIAQIESPAVLNAYKHILSFSRFLSVEGLNRAAEFRASLDKMIADLPPEDLTDASEIQKHWNETPGYTGHAHTTNGLDNEEGMSEAELAKDTSFLKASSAIYEAETGNPWTGDAEELANWGLDYMGWFNYNMASMGLKTADNLSGTPEQQTAFLYMMDAYDAKNVSWNGTWRMAKGLAFDPTTYMGLGTLGGALVLKEGAKQTAKETLKAVLRASVRLFSKEATRDAAKVAAKEATKAATKEATKVAVKEATEEVVETGIKATIKTRLKTFTATHSSTILTTSVVGGGEGLIYGRADDYMRQLNEMAQGRLKEFNEARNNWATIIGGGAGILFGNALTVAAPILIKGTGKFLRKSFSNSTKHTEAKPPADIVVVAKSTDAADGVTVTPVVMEATPVKSGIVLDVKVKAPDAPATVITAKKPEPDTIQKPVSSWAFLGNRDDTPGAFSLPEAVYAPFDERTWGHHNPTRAPETGHGKAPEKTTGAKAMSITGNLAYKALDTFRITDLYYIGRNMPTYIARSFSWRKMHGDHTWGLFNKFEALKDNSATNMFLNINAQNAVDSKLSTGNLIIKNADGKTKYDATGALNDLKKFIGKEDGESSIGIGKGNLLDAINTSRTQINALKETFEGTKHLRNITDVIKQQADNSNLTGSSSVTNVKYTQQHATDYINATLDQIKVTTKSGLEQITDPSQKTIITQEIERIDALAQETISKISNVPDNGAKNVNIANLLQNYARQLVKHADEINNTALQPVFDGMDDIASRNITAVSDAANHTQNSLSNITGMIDSLDISVKRLESNIVSINRNPADEAETYVGGSLVARLLAYDIDPGVKKLSSFRETISKRANDTESGIKNSVSTIENSFEYLSKALEEGDENLIGRRLDELLLDLKAQENSITDTPSIISDDIKSSYTDAVKTLSDMGRTARTYVFDSTHRQSGEAKHGINNPGENRRKGKAMGNNVLLSPTKWFVREEVGIVDREIAPSEIIKGQLISPDIKRAKALLKEGKAPGIEHISKDLRYTPHEGVGSLGLKRLDQGKKGNTHKFLEQAFRGQEDADTAKQQIINDKILEHTTTFLNKQDMNGLVEAYKWLATYYSTGAKIKDADGNLTGKIDTNRKQGITKELMGLIEKKRHALVGQGEVDPYAGDNIQIVKHMQAAQVALGANNVRAGWRDAVNDITNRRFSGDFWNEFWDKSPSEHDPARTWVKEVAVRKLNPVMWHFRSRSAFFFNASVLTASYYAPGLLIGAASLATHLLITEPAPPQPSATAETTKEQGAKKETPRSASIYGTEKEITLVLKVIDSYTGDKKLDDLTKFVRGNLTDKSALGVFNKEAEMLGPLCLFNKEAVGILDRDILTKLNEFEHQCP